MIIKNPLTQTSQPNQALSMSQNRLEGFASFLVMDYLEKEDISLPLRQALINEFNQKGLFQSLVTISGEQKPSTYNELASQLPKSNEHILKNVLYNQYQITNRKIYADNMKKAIDESVRKKYDIFDRETRRKRLLKTNFTRRGYIPFRGFPSEIFTHNWNKFKSIFGHSRRDPDPDDPINGSPVYNLTYDKHGKYVVSAADDGIIKVWNTTNGELTNSIMGHDADINAIALSECGKYLASCSDNGIVRVWELETGKPTAVFKDHHGVVCSLNFFKVTSGNKDSGVYKSGLASASDDGTVKIYYEENYIHNKGLLKKNQEHLTLKIEDINPNKGFSSIEFHPEGFMAAGTSGGSIIIWNKLHDINSRHIERHRIIKNEHNKDCHLTLWNKEGNRLLSASFDGTAKIWPWNSNNFEANRDMKTLFVFEGELGKGVDIKCCAVAWSCNGRFAITSFCRKIQRRGDDNPQLQANIQIYDSKINSRLHKFDKTYDGGLLENYIFILEPHPISDAILVSADYDGKIIIWNIELGVMLNCFVENCAHLGLPLLEAPILDGRFSPDGLNFCVTTFYGSISLYGYGDKDLFLTTPNQQFFSKEFMEFKVDTETGRVLASDTGTDMYMIDKGALCSADKKEYPRNSILPEDYLDFDVNEYYQKYCEVMEKLRHQGKQEYVGVNSQACIKAIPDRLKEIMFHETQRRYLKSHLLKRQVFKNLKMADLLKPSELNQDNVNVDHNNGRHVNLAAPRQSEQQEPQQQSHRRRDGERSARATATASLVDADRETQELIEKLLQEDSDYDPEGGEERTNNAANQAARGGRRRRGRKSRAEMEAEAKEEEERNTRQRNTSFIEEEDDEEEIAFNRRRSSQRRATRLSLEEHDDEEEEEHFKDSDEEDEETERRMGTRRTERRSRLHTLSSMVGTRSTRSTRDLAEEGRSLRSRDTASMNQSTRMQVEEETKTGGGGRVGLRGNMGVYPNARSLRERRPEGIRSAREVFGAQPMRSSRGRIQIEENVIEETNCARCGLENAKVRCSEGCSKVFHSGCLKKSGRDGDMGGFSCFTCIYHKKRKEKVRTQLDREWLEVLKKTDKPYLPQVGDTVTYIPQAHEEFVIHNFDVLRFSTGEVFPFERLRYLIEDNVCLIKRIKYQFPLKSMRHKGPNKVLMKISLEVQEPAEHKGATLTVTYFQNDDSEFLIPRELYVNSIRTSQSLQKETQVFLNHHGKDKLTFLSERAPKEEGPFALSYWKSLVLFDHSEDGGYVTRRARRGDNDRAVIYASPWDIISGDSSTRKLSTDEEITDDFTEKAIHDLKALCERKEEISEPFMFDVDKREYPRYMSSIAFEMNIDKILQRLKGRYYRHKEAVLSDLDLIRLNCIAYNGPDMPISDMATELTEDAAKLIGGEMNIDSVPTPISPVKTRNQRRRGSLVVDNDEPQHHKEEFSVPQKGPQRKVTPEEKNESRTLFKNVQEVHEEENEAGMNRSSRTRRQTDLHHPEEPAGRATRSTRASSAHKPETTEDQTGYSSKLRNRNTIARPEVFDVPEFVHHHFPQQQAKQPERPSLSREERMQKRLVARGETLVADDEGENAQEEEEEVEDKGISEVFVVQETEDETAKRRKEPVRNHHPSVIKPVPVAVNVSEKRVTRHSHQPQPQPQEAPRTSGRTTRQSNLQSKMVQKTETMRLRNSRMHGVDENADADDGTDGSASVGDEKAANKKQTLKSRLRRGGGGTYTQYFEDVEEESEEEDDFEELEEEEGADDEGDEFAKEDLIEEIIQPKRVDLECTEELPEQEGLVNDKKRKASGTNDEEDFEEKPLEKVKVVVGRNEETGDGEVQAKRYPTRKR